MKIAGCIFLLSIRVLTCLGQNTIALPKIINYSKSDFHAGNQTWDIGQDSRGVLYFANNEGLLSYDGSYWKSYPMPNGTIMRALAIDERDRIFAGAQDEIGYFSPGQNGNLHYNSLRELIPKGQNKFADIWRIVIFRESVFFQASDRIFEYRNNSIRSFPAVNEWIFLKKAGDRLFAQDKTQGLFQYRDNGWYPSVNNKLLENAALSGIMPLDNDSLLLSTGNKGLFFWCKDTILKKRSPVPDLLSRTYMYVSTKINRREFVSGTTADGCLVMDLEGHVVQKISHKEGLQNNNVLSVFLDKDKNLWVGLNNGISFIAYNSSIKYIRPDKDNELSGYGARIFKDRLYIATSDGAYFVSLSPAQPDLSFTTGDFRHIERSNGEVWRLDEVNQQILLGQHTGTWLVKNNEAVHLQYGIGSWLFVPVSPVIPSEYILVGTYTGLKMLEFGREGFIDKGKITGLQESLRFLEIDNNNTLWASHPYRGIYRLQLSPDNKSMLSRIYTDKMGLPSTLGNYVYKVKNRVVVCTGQGVYEYDTKTDRFIPSPFLTPVFGHIEVRYVTEDKDGNIWFCSGKDIGVVHFTGVAGAIGGKPFTITYFPELKGQVLSGFENIYPYDRKNIFIGSEKGIIHLNYEKYSSNKLSLNVLLEQVKAVGRSDSVIFGGYFPRSGAGYQQDEKEMLKLPKSYNSFHFEYSAPFYGWQTNIEYSYQLEGYDPGWSAWSPRSEKDYTNLPDGKYHFKIKAHDNLGHESGTVAYGFVVTPPWYKTAWAFISYALLLFLLLYSGYLWQKRKLRLQLEKSEAEQQRLKYIHQLELEQNEKEIMSLQNEKLASEIHFKNKALADATMHLVERGDALGKVREKLEMLFKKTGNNPDIKSAILLLNDVEKNNSNWEHFASSFNELNNDFLTKLKNRYPSLSETDLKVCAYLQLKLSSKEIAQLLTISLRGVEMQRYRLRKKLHLPADQTLNGFFDTI